MKIKTIMFVGFLIVALSELPGCAFIQRHRAIDQACVNSPVLYTDLATPVKARHYALPNGQGCPVFNEGKRHA